MRFPVQTCFGCKGKFHKDEFPAHFVGCPAVSQCDWCKEYFKAGQQDAHLDGCKVYAATGASPAKSRVRRKSTPGAPSCAQPKRQKTQPQEAKPQQPPSPKEVARRHARSCPPRSAPAPSTG
ncbi:unnamed protein product [Prorocentrum cordatum]|uniref:Uncharacterized protein n=1 Tax=Prorocentrum cordatum TaxID=2364126 RepID=A0ABN9YHD1_9DINO|nr:unnamed protein product [Polarella glacialis]